MRKRKTTVTTIALACLIGWGCASLTPGSDPIVVRVEQAQTSAMATFDLVLHVDQADRGFWRTNAPAFHQFCEWLRTPTPYSGTNLARCQVMQLNVSDLKLAYKASKSAGSSNALYSAWATLNTAIGQSTSWTTIVTTPTHP